MCLTELSCGEGVELSGLKNSVVSIEIKVELIEFNVKPIEICGFRVGRCLTLQSYDQKCPKKVR